MVLPNHLVEALVRSKARTELLREMSAKRWLAVTYRKSLYGGYQREDGTFTTKPHVPAIRFHEACKDPLNFTFFIGGGRRSSKTWTAMSEFCSWIRGERPWDGTKTAPRGTGRRWLMCAPNFSTHFPDVLCPYFEQRMGDMIVDVIKNQQKCPQTYILKTGDTVRCNSYEQYLKAAHDQTTVFQSGSIAGAYFDEHPPREVYLGVRRGLVSGASEFGWGKAIIAATPEHCAWIKDEIYDESWNKGGGERSIWSTEFSIYDNPGNTEESIRRNEIGLSEEEREAILYGRFRHLSGRVYSDFDEHVHVFSEWDPLLNAAGTAPSDWPVICSIDPHDRRPPFISWAAISPKGDFYFIDEWPHSDYERIHRDAGGFPDWKAHIEEIEAGFPGGPSRVMFRVMDPKFGGSKKAGNRMTIQREMRNLGLAFDTKFFDGGEAVLLTTGHRAVKTLLSWPHKGEDFTEINSPKLYVHERCRNIIWGFLHYTHDEHMKSDDKAPKETPKEVGKDPMDTVRYAVMSRPHWMDWRNRGEWFEAQAARALAGASGF